MWIIQSARRHRSLARRTYMHSNSIQGTVWGNYVVMVTSPVRTIGAVTTFSLGIGPHYNGCGAFCKYLSRFNIAHSVTYVMVKVLYSDVTVLWEFSKLLRAVFRVINMSSVTSNSSMRSAYRATIGLRRGFKSFRYTVFMCDNFAFNSSVDKIMYSRLTIEVVITETATLRLFLCHILV